MYVSSEVAEIISRAFSLARSGRFEYVTPEVVLYAACQNPVFARAFAECGGSVRKLDRDLRTYLEEYMEQGSESEPQLSQGMVSLLSQSWETARSSNKPMVELAHILCVLYGLEESYAVYYMRAQGVERVDLLREMTIASEEIARQERHRKNIRGRKAAKRAGAPLNGQERGAVCPESVRSVSGGAESIEAESGQGLEKNHGGASGNRGDVEENHGGAPGNGDSRGSGHDPGVGTGDIWDDIFSRDLDNGIEEPEPDYEEMWNDEDEWDEDDGDSPQEGFWRQYAACLNEVEGQNPLIGRTEELERTMQILCRKEKNNPLHIGEPGVGKTAITYGLVRLINEGKVPAPLAGAKIIALDLCSLLVGTQFRGDFEERFKRVMDSIAIEDKPIVYIDEIHNIVGAGAVNGGSFDISNMLKPYLTQGHIRFIGAITYEEYKKHFEKNKSLVRRFQKMDIKEPDKADAVRILEGLKDNYEAFHGVRYEEGVLAYAVEMSAKYINERFLPDKAIDLIDEAGAYRRLHPIPEQGMDAGDTAQKIQAAQTAQTVDRQLIDEILSKICQIPKQAVESDETAALATLEQRLRARVFGQDEAIAQVVNAVKFSRAGLLEEGKPLASLLFAGPTGVGKTEIAKSLAAELGVPLIRFDMSEYEEKHAVAKLIGAPAGYVGYEEGGLLTEEIRKKPHSVLLLDEVEKAHPDIYNILLQVFDYATLTDNQGRKADFRNVIIIMTSNAGASRIGKHGIGFQGRDVGSDIILEEVKRIFQPEFRNRLNRIVVFKGLDESMAERIVGKKLGELSDMLLRRNVRLSADAHAKGLAKEKGISAEYGAREIERVIQGEIKPLLVDEILFGALKEGGSCSLTAEEGEFRLEICAPENPAGGIDIKGDDIYAGLSAE